MKRFVPFFLLMSLLFVSPAAPAGIAERVKKSYNGCMKFLAMPIAKQKATAQRAGYSLQSARSACQQMKRNGLAKSIRIEREYQRSSRGGWGDGSYSTPSDDPYGGSDGGFAGRGVCTGGTCVGPEGTTVCTGGTCVGPNGTTVCTGGTCM